MNCYLSKNYKDISSAGNKAKTDIERIMDSLGFRNVGLKRSFHTNPILGFLLTLMGVLKAPFGLKRGDNLVLQYPLKKYFTFVCRMAHAKGAKVIVIIHDLGSFRRKKLTVRQEIDRLNHADYIIVHNRKMKEWLEAHGCRAHLGVLGIFDYLSDTIPDDKVAARTYSIVYAGALNRRKNTFLYEVGAYFHHYCFNLYGSGFETDAAVGKKQFNCMGFIPSDRLIASVRGDFGLVWDGNSLDGCSGDFGEYLQYNNPHKTSLYIRCHLPVIIWEKAALADFVKTEGIGICVDSLKNLEKKLDSLSDEEYEAMKRRTVAVSNRLSKGCYFTEAVNEAVNWFRQTDGKTSV